MCCRCTELEEEVAYLRGLLGEQETAARVADFRARLDLLPLQARVLDRLYTARGRVVTYATLHDLFPDPDRAADGNGLAMVISYIRKALGGRFTVENLKSDGYRLSPVGVSRVHLALLSSPPQPRPGRGGPAFASRFTYQRPGPKGRFSDDEVRAIRTFPANHAVTARVFKCSSRFVSGIRARTSYADVPDLAPITQP